MHKQGASVGDGRCRCWRLEVGRCGRSLWESSRLEKHGDGRPAEYRWCTLLCSIAAGMRVVAGASSVRCTHWERRWEMAEDTVGVPMQGGIAGSLSPRCANSEHR